MRPATNLFWQQSSSFEPARRVTGAAWLGCTGCLSPGALCLERIGLAAHRVVHGGGLVHDPDVITPAVEEELSALIPLAPLPQRRRLAQSAGCGSLASGPAQWACFDTGFSQHLWSRAALLCGGRSLALGRGLRRFGFHEASSHQHIQRVVMASTAIPPSGPGLIRAALGAVLGWRRSADGRSIDTTQWLHPFEGW